MKRLFLSHECADEVKRTKALNAKFGSNYTPPSHVQLYADNHGKAVEYFGRYRGWNGSSIDYCAVRFPGESHLRCVKPNMLVEQQ